MFDFYLSELKDSLKALNTDFDPDIKVTSVSTDSRSVKPGDLFFALIGEVSDGHLYVKNALDNGAAAVCVSHIVEDCDVSRQVLVSDTMESLRLLATFYRNRFNIPFIAITGSSGKTTTKDLTASVLSQKYKVYKTPENLNSTTGVPLTLFMMGDDTQIAVIEISMSHPGEIYENSKIVRHETAIITNVGTAHIEYLGSRENIYKAKTEIVSFMHEGDSVIVNYNDDMLSKLTSDTFEVVQTGFDAPDVNCVNVEFKNNRSYFDVIYKGETYHFTFSTQSYPAIFDALCAIACGFKYGVTPDSIQKGLDEVMLSSNRMEVVEVNGVELINDTYNANPEAVKAVTQVLANKEGRRKIEVIGDMLELGQMSETLHYGCGEYAATMGIDMFLSVGNFADALYRGFSDNDKLHFAKAFSDKNELTSYLKTVIKEGDCVLFKASRGMQLEKVFLDVKGWLENE